jgi:hypothetical protein
VQQEDDAVKRNDNDFFTISGTLNADGTIGPPPAAMSLIDVGGLCSDNPYVRSFGEMISNLHLFGQHKAADALRAELENAGWSEEKINGTEIKITLDNGDFFGGERVS